MTDVELAAFRERVEWLRDEFPAELPVHVHRVPFAKRLGDATKHDGHFLIRVAKRLPFSEAVYALFEEFAHCLEWDDTHDHGPAWAAAYGEIIRADEARDTEG